MSQKKSLIIYDLLEQIESNLNAKNYYTALFVTLTIPDICGALASSNGMASGNKYAEWFNDCVAHKHFAWGKQWLTGEDCYQIRCAMLHQGRSDRPKISYSSVRFMIKQPNTAIVGGIILIKDEALKDKALKDKTLYIDLLQFCQNIVQSAYDWLEEVENDPLFKKNSESFTELFALSFE